jgi:hypothetical protein
MEEKMNKSTLSRVEREQEIDEELAHKALNPTEWECTNHVFLAYATSVSSFGGYNSQCSSIFPYKDYTV